MSNCIYAQLHIPKTAGYTFRYHILKNFKEEEQLLLDFGPLGLDIYKQPFDNKKYKNYCWEYLSSLNNKQKNKIKIIHGHIVPYGIHKFFSKPVRYFTFIRNPIERTISVYNYLCNSYDKEFNQKEKYEYYKRTLLINKKVPTFYKWLKERYDAVQLKGFLTMFGHLKFNGYIEGEQYNRESIMRALDRFYFVGLTENFSDEILYIYNKLNVHKYFIDQNISKKVFRYKKKLVDEKRILDKNTLDMIIYEYGRQLNTNFKNDNSEFDRVIKRTSIERNILINFTQFVFAPRQTMIRISKLIKNKDNLFAETKHVSKCLKKNS